MRRGQVGLPVESGSGTGGRGRPRQAGPACRWAAGEEAEAGWAGKEEGKRAGVRFPGLREEKEKREEGLGQAENELGKGKRFGIFLRRNKHIQLKFEFKEFKFKLKSKQIDNAMQHECNTNKKTLFNLEKQPIFIFLY